MLLTAAVAAIAVVALSVTQLTERETAQRLLARTTNAMLEIDRYVAQAWPSLEAAASGDEPIPLDGFPIALQLDPAGLSDGPDAVADAIASATASLLYEQGFDIFAESPQVFRLVTRGGVFDATIGRLTGGGRDIAAVALIVSGTLTVILALTTASQASGWRRFGAPAASIAVGAALVWIVAAVAQSATSGRADATLDVFLAELWLIAADAAALTARNAVIVAIAAGLVALGSLVASALTRPREPTPRLDRY